MHAEQNRLTAGCSAAKTLPGNPPECLILRGKIRNFYTHHQQTHPHWRVGRNHVPPSTGIKKIPLEK
jgi:hypothetical protein